MHLAQRRARQLDRTDHVVGVALHQHDLGAFHGHVGAGADREADIGLRQGRRIVDAVADHGDLVTLVLQFLDL